MVRLVKILAGVLIGMLVGYFIGAFVACDWLYPTSNLCGIYAVFVTAPIGLVIGAVSGWLLSRPQHNSVRG